jgi:hypothetical protein
MHSGFGIKLASGGRVVVGYIFLISWVDDVHYFGTAAEAAWYRKESPKCMPLTDEGVGPPTKNKTPRGEREQRGAKKYSRNKGVRGVFVPPMGPSVVLVFFPSSLRNDAHGAPLAVLTRNPNQAIASTSLSVPVAMQPPCQSRSEVWIRVLTPVGDKNCCHSTRSHTSPK